MLQPFLFTPMGRMIQGVEFSNKGAALLDKLLDNVHFFSVEPTVDFFAVIKMGLEIFRKLVIIGIHTVSVGHKKQVDTAGMILSQVG